MQVQSEGEFGGREGISSESRSPLVKGFAVIDVDGVRLQVRSHDDLLLRAGEVVNHGGDEVNETGALGAGRMVREAQANHAELSGDTKDGGTTDIKLVIVDVYT